MLTLFTQRIPLYYAIVGMIAIGTLSFYISRSNVSASPSSPASDKSAVNTASMCSYSLPRLGGYAYIRPLLFAEQNCESDRYLPLKQSLNNAIEGFKASGTISSASVYVKDLDEEGWIGVNDAEKFDPGSLMKVPVLIAFLKMSEDDPAILNKTVYYDKPDNTLPVETFKSKTLQPKHIYSIRELLRYMVVYSDNDAARLLLQYMDEGKFNKTFTDLGLPAPQKGVVYPFSAREYSVFMKVLYDSSYLTIRDSEYANSLLVEGDFNQGIISGLPAGVKTAHKFGEWGYNNVCELHETGIVFFNKSPYLITVMTKGNDMKKLPGVLSSLSKITYQNVVSNN